MQARYEHVPRYIYIYTTVVTGPGYNSTRRNGEDAECGRRRSRRKRTDVCPQRAADHRTASIRHRLSRSVSAEPAPLYGLVFFFLLLLSLYTYILIHFFNDESIKLVYKKNTYTYLYTTFFRPSTDNFFFLRSSSRYNIILFYAP